MNIIMHKKVVNRLFDGDDSLFKKILMHSKRYGEYGSGESTKWVAKNTHAEILSVDTSIEWATKIEGEISNRGKVTYIDVGPTGDWGHPLSYEKNENFKKYAEAIWDNGFDPDTVLIDGRFRVLCFLVSLKNSRPGTTIIFDDYANRPKYHIVEKIIKPFIHDGRQAIFRTPYGNVNDERIQDLIKKFEMVVD